MVKRSESFCLWCGKRLDKQDFFSIFKEDKLLCYECQKLLVAKNIQFKIKELTVEGIYPYQGSNRDMMLQYKEFYDEALAPIFLEQQLQRIQKKYRGYTIVPIPSNYLKEKDRGFNQVDLMLEKLNLEKIHLFNNQSYQQQKLQSRTQRVLNSRNIVRNQTDISNKRILLVDDICTTGSTLYAAYSLLTDYHVKALVIMYSTSWIKVTK